MTMITVIIVSCVVAWIIFSALMVTVLCVNASLLSREQEQFDRAAFIEHWLKQEGKE
jgi:hypothetical protein